LASLEALRARLGEGFYEEALRQPNAQPSRLLPVDGKTMLMNNPCNQSMEQGMVFDIGS